MPQPDFESDPMDSQDLWTQLEETFYEIPDREELLTDFFRLEHGAETIGDYSTDLDSTAILPGMDDELRCAMVISAAVSAGSFALSRSLMTTRDWTGYAEMLHNTSQASTLAFCLASVTLGVRYAVKKHRLRESNH